MLNISQSKVFLIREAAKQVLGLNHFRVFDLTRIVALKSRRNLLRIAEISKNLTGWKD